VREASTTVKSQSAHQSQSVSPVSSVSCVSKSLIRLISLVFEEAPTDVEQEKKLPQSDGVRVCVCEREGESTHARRNDARR
jgi:hypothetical protein